MRVLGWCNAEVILLAPLLSVVLVWELNFHTLQFTLRLENEMPNAEGKTDRLTSGLISETLLNTIVPGVGRLPEGLDDVFRPRSLRYVEVLALGFIPVSEMDTTAKLTRKILSSSQPTFAFAPLS